MQLIREIDYITNHRPNTPSWHRVMMVRALIDEYEAHMGKST